MKGQIITFYSYKGGVGRSMAMANVAWILASNGKKVLAMDWDLEAPGLHRYFRPFLVDKDLMATGGLIDFVLEYATTAMSPGGAAPARDWYKRYADILRYAVSLEWEFPSYGALDFVPAGAQDGGYASKITSFNWQSFYERLGGWAFLEAVKEKMRAEYDYILIDSRSGITDTTGICTIQMPDVLVVCFTLNRQSVEGSAEVAESALSQRESQQGSALTIFPVPMRVELAEKEMMQKSIQDAKVRFSTFPNFLPYGDLSKYWGDVQFLYTPFYAYHEILAVFTEQSFRRDSLLGSAERLTSYLTAGEVRQANPIPEAERQHVVAEYSGRADV